MSSSPAISPVGKTEGLFVRCGNASCPGERTFWFVGHSRADFEAAKELIESLKARYQRLDILMTVPDPETRRWLRDSFPGAVVLPPPLPVGIFANRYLINLNVRGLMLLGEAVPADRGILRAAHRRAVPSAIAQTPRAGSTGERPPQYVDSLTGRFQHHFVTSEAARSQLLAAGVDGEQVSLLEGDGETRAAKALPVISYLLGLDLKLMRSTQRPVRRRLEQLALKGMAQPRLRRLLANKVERIDGIGELRDRLGDPGTILCLGNGPSSEDAVVGDTAYDSLFRVNHVWLDRGFLTQPDMVFTGSKATLSLVKGAIFGLQSIKSEARLLVTRFLLPLYPKVRYATIERFGLYLNEPRWQGIRPTNGAAMLATAVALQPPRLVISGIDLFSHPAGTYPGDTATPNAYSPGHEAESELALLLAALDLYQGELIILSSALKERWEEHRASRRPAPRDASHAG